MARPIPRNSENPRNGAPNPARRLAELGIEPVDSDDGPTVDAWDEGASPEELHREIQQLREQLAESERLLQDLRQEAEQALHDQQREFESLLEEKSDLIRSLHMKLQEGSARPAPAPAPVRNLPREDDLMALSEELERERAQLKEDEEALMQQMAHMEVQMSRERAELARQRTEMTRLQSEIRHELDLASRDAALRERLAPLQRRSQELLRRSGPGSGPAPAPAPGLQPPPVAMSEDAIGDEEPTPPSAQRANSSGILRRFFG